MPYFRVKLDASPDKIDASIDRPLAFASTDPTSGAMEPKLDKNTLKPLFVPLGINAFGLKVSRTISTNEVVITFDLVNSVGGLADWAKQLGCPAPTAWWRNAGQFFSLVREETDRIGSARWDQYHGCNHVGAYQEVPFSSLNQGKPDYVISNYNWNWTVKLTKDSGAFLHIDPPSPADGSAPSFSTPVDEIVWKDPLAYCESGGFMPR